MFNYLLGTLHPPAVWAGSDLEKTRVCGVVRRHGLQVAMTAESDSETVGEREQGKSFCEPGPLESTGSSLA